MTAASPAAQRWRDELAAWAIDPAILAAAPESPYVLPPELFAAGSRTVAGATRNRGVEALPAGGTVLDVGCGAGAAGLALVPPAGALLGVDESADMLAAFTAAAAERGLPLTTVQGRWPDVAAAVPVAHVVVCSHVLFNVADLPPFAAALTAHARARVVVEVTAAHPWAGIGPLWERAHGQPRPAGPTAQLAAEVLREAGLDVRVEESLQPEAAHPWEARVAGMRRRLCLPADREPEVEAWMRELGMERLRERAVATIWWDATA